MARWNAERDEFLLRRLAEGATDEIISYQLSHLARVELEARLRAEGLSDEAVERVWAASPGAMMFTRAMVTGRRTRLLKAMRKGLALTSRPVREVPPPIRRPRISGPRYSTVGMSLTARLMGDPPPGRTPWAEGRAT